MAKPLILEGQQWNISDAMAKKYKVSKRVYVTKSERHGLVEVLLSNGNKIDFSTRSLTVKLS